MSTDKIMQWFGEDVFASRLARARAFWNGAERFVVSVNASEHMYRQAFDEKTILECAPENLREQARLPGLNVPAFFADFGTVSTAKHWGGTPRFDSTGGNIFLDPVAQTVDEALGIEPRTVDDPAMDGPLAIRLYRALCERLDTGSLWLRVPDLQGPLNTAGMVLNQEELLVTMYTEPEKIHRFLERVTRLLIAYVRFFMEQTAGRVCGFIWPYTFYPCDRGVAFTEDLMPLLPADLYAEFGVPCLRAMSEAFGGLQLHCCGDWGRHAPALKASGLPVEAVEFHYPFTRVEELECLADRTVLVPYISLDKQDRFSSVSEYYRHLLKNTPDAYRYWFAWPSDSEEAIVFAKEHGF